MTTHHAQYGGAFATGPDGRCDATQVCHVHATLRGGASEGRTAIFVDSHMNDCGLISRSAVEQLGVAWRPMGSEDRVGIAHVYMAGTPMTPLGTAFVSFEGRVGGTYLRTRQQFFVVEGTPGISGMVSGPALLSEGSSVQFGACGECASAAAARRGSAAAR
jgi:hypothetical protein